MNDDDSIDKMIRLLLLTASRLQSYIDDGIPVYNSELIVDEDYRITSAENRIRDYKIRIEKDKELIKKINQFAKKRKSFKS